MTTTSKGRRRGRNRAVAGCPSSAIVRPPQRLPLGGRAAVAVAAAALVLLLATTTTCRSFSAQPRVVVVSPRGAATITTTPRRQEQRQRRDEHRYYEIDYTAANEYVESHYGVRSYFANDVATKEPIFDARLGVVADDYCVDDDESSSSSRLLPATLESCGFALVDAPLSPVQQQVEDWANTSQIEQLYLPQLKDVLVSAYSKESSSSTIRRVVFWNPMLREANMTQSRPSTAGATTTTTTTTTTPTASFARYPHVDVDVGAYRDAERFADLIEKNRIRCVRNDEDDDFSREDVVSSIERGWRFAIVNAWRNIDDEPVTVAPLGLLATRYCRNNSDRSFPAFPDARPDMERSRWYSFPNMTKDEVLLFCQYDRDASKPSDLWHCALLKEFQQSNDDHNNRPDAIAAVTTAGNRKSFDVRALVIFDEVVPPEQHRDRFRTTRTRPFMTQLQSADFCSDQARRRRTDTT